MLFWWFRGCCRRLRVRCHRFCQPVSVSELELPDTDADAAPSRRRARTRASTQSSATSMFSITHAASGAESHRGMGSDLINDLLALEWPFISKLFEKMLRDSVAAQIQHQLPSGVSIRFGNRCDLGTKPIVLKNCSTFRYGEYEIGEGQETTNLQVVGEIDYCGDSAIDLELSIGSVQLVQLRIGGPVVIELVKMRETPPYFSGARVYFPDLPEVDIKVSTSVMGIEANFSYLRRLVVKQLSNSIAKRAVLPHIFGFDLDKHSDSVKCPRPQGVLRVAIFSAAGLLSPSGSADPYVEVRVGADMQRTPTVRKTAHPSWIDTDCVLEFCVTSPSKQAVKFAVYDENCGFFGSKSCSLLGVVNLPVTEIVEQQESHEATRFSLELLLPEAGGVAAGTLEVATQWRPFARREDLDALIASASGVFDGNSWNLSSPTKSEWLLLADIYEATALPTAEAQTDYWASVTVHAAPEDEEGLGPPIASHQLPAVSADTVVHHGLKLLRKKGVPPELVDCVTSSLKQNVPLVREKLLKRSVTTSAASVERHQSLLEQSRVGGTFCSTAGGTFTVGTQSLPTGVTAGGGGSLLQDGASPTSQGVAEPRPPALSAASAGSAEEDVELMDAVWGSIDGHFQLLLPDVRACTLKITVLRPAVGLRKPKSHADRLETSEASVAVGSVQYSMSKLLELPRCSTGIIHVPFEDGMSAGMALLKLKLQVCPLCPPLSQQEARPVRRSRHNSSASKLRRAPCRIDLEEDAGEANPSGWYDAATSAFRRSSEAARRAEMASTFAGALGKPKQSLAACPEDVEAGSEPEAADMGAHRAAGITTSSFGDAASPLL